MSELSRRIEGIQIADTLLGADTDADNENILELPVIVFDALLPGQRISGRTSDETFSRFLARLGLGGLFCMVSVDFSQRKIRRNGVVCKIEVIDSPNAECVGDNGNILSEVQFQIVGLRRCRVVGQPEGMKARIGRWRGQYDPDGEEKVLGFGEERFVDVEEHVASLPANTNTYGSEEEHLSVKDWNDLSVDCAIQDVDSYEAETIEKAESLIPLLKKWLKLASDAKTYDNADVVALSRVMKGQPGLRVDPAALLRKVQGELGEQPPAIHPVAFAFWGAALINPLPPLGVSPEIRGRVMEAPDAISKLKILEWGTKRSIANLEGTAPL